ALPARVRDLEAAPLGRGPDAHDRVLRAGTRDRLVVTGDLALGHLDHDRVRVVAGQVVLAAALVAGADTGAEVDRVERLAEVDEERIVALAGEHLAATAQRLDALCRESVVIRHRLRADVARHDRQVAPDDLLRL